MKAIEFVTHIDEIKKRNIIENLLLESSIKIISTQVINEFINVTYIL